MRMPFGVFKGSPIFVAMLVMVVPCVLPANATEPARMALVIGNDAYKQLPPLKNAINDAALMAQTLSKLGFEVRSLFNTDAETLVLRVTEFGGDLARTDAVGLVYFAGHGVQIGGVNYLLPIDTSRAEQQLVVHGLNLDDLLISMASGRSADRLNIAVIDACRENLLGSSGLSDVKHLLPKGLQIFLAYATSPGDKALDGKGSIGPYAGALAKSIKTPFRDIDKVFNLTNELVVEKTGGKQSPWYTRGFSGRFYFNAGSEDEFWRVTSGSKIADNYRDFLEKYPDSRYARTACVIDAELTAAEVNPDEFFDPRSGLSHCPQGVGGAVTGFRFGDTSTEPLDQAEIEKFSCEDLWIARNAMLQRHGYCFQDAKEMAYFGNAGCTSSSEEVLLTSETGGDVVFRNYHFLRSNAALKFCKDK